MIKTAENEQLFLYFVNMIVNDIIYLLDQTLDKLKAIHQFETKMHNPQVWNAETPEARAEQTQVYSLTFLGFHIFSYFFSGKFEQ